jgi:hypothetical protein
MNPTPSLLFAAMNSVASSREEDQRGADDNKIGGVQASR